MLFPCIKVNFRTLFFCGLFGILLLVIGAYLGFSFVPILIKKKIWDAKVLVEGTDQWDTFMKIPFSFEFKVYLFIVKNHEDILDGAKPIVEEQGPYVYKLQRWKENVSSNNIMNEISYYEYEKYEFDQEASGTLSEEDTVTILNAPYLGFVQKAETNPAAAAMLPAVEEALKFVFGENNGLFLTNVTVKNILFDGIRICKNGCADDGFLPKLICNMIRKEINATKQMRMDGQDILYASFHYRNNTHQGFFTVDSGVKYKNTPGEVIRLNNQTVLDTWIDNKFECNKVGGLTNVFPPDVGTDAKLTTFSEDICRKIAFNFSRTETVGAIKGNRYTALNTSFSNTLENACYCVNQTENLDGNFGCLYDGILDLSNCQGIELQGPWLYCCKSKMFYDEGYGVIIFQYKGSFNKDHFDNKYREIAK